MEMLLQSTDGQLASGAQGPSEDVSIKPTRTAGPAWYLSHTEVWGGGCSGALWKMLA